MAQVKVTFKIHANAKDAYIVGSTKNLGEWDAKKAVALTKEDCFTVAKQFEVGSFVEFKVLSAKSFDAVEKGYNNEEVENHSFVASKGLVVELEIPNFNK